MSNPEISFLHRPDPARQGEIIRRTFDLVSASLGGGDEAATAELERLMNDDHQIGFNVLYALFTLYAGEIRAQAEAEGREPADLLLELERALGEKGDA